MCLVTGFIILLSGVLSKYLESVDFIEMLHSSVCAHGCLCVSLCVCAHIVVCVCVFNRMWLKLCIRSWHWSRTENILIIHLSEISDSVCECVCVCLL